LRDERLVKTNAAERREIRNRPDLHIEALGSGSDYSPFLQHLGIASLDFGYGGEGNGGSYHSVYDSFDHFTRFIDPNFDYGIALAQTSGRAVLRMANAEVLPFEFNDFAETIVKYGESVSKLADDMREETREMNRLIHEKTLQAAADPEQPFVEPEPKSEAPYLNFAPLQNAVAKLQESARKYDAARKELEAEGKSLASSGVQKALGEVLMKTERALTHEEGLPRRPWYQHTIYAPGFYTGYGVKTLPGIREAIEERKWTEATEQVDIVARAIEKFAGEINRAAELLQGRGQTIAQRQARLGRSGWERN
jgi:N-acetylated-alpha-linked acidic dipeptidase